MAEFDTPPSTTGTEPSAEAITPPIEEQSKRNGRPKAFKSTIQEVLFVLTATMAMGMASFLFGAGTVITAQIGRDLHMTSAQITWINASSSLVCGAFLLFFAKVADTFGRRSLLIFSLGGFSVTAMITGFATNAMYVDVFCGILGLWCAAAVPPAVGILGASYPVPSSRKNKAFACFSAGNPVGFVMGSVFSGIAADIFDWRASFYLLAIVYFVFFVASIWTVPVTQFTREKFSLETLKRFDLLGIGLSMAGIALFCSSLTIAGDAPNGWKTSYVLVLLILGILLIGSFIAWENYCKYPLMPLHIWKDRNFTLINVVVLLGFMSFTTNSFWLSLFMQNVQRLSPLSVAVHLLPQAIGGIIVNIVAAFVLHKVNNKILAGIGALAYCGASLLLATMKADSSYWAFIFPSLLLSVMGADLQFNVALLYVTSSLPPNQQSLAGGIFNTVTKICGAVGLGISTSIYDSESNGHAALQTAVRPYSMVFWFCLASAGLGFCCVPFLTIGKQGHSEKRDSIGELSGSDGIGNEKIGGENDEKVAIAGMEMTDMKGSSENPREKELYEG